MTHRRTVMAMVLATVGCAVTTAVAGPERGCGGEGGASRERNSSSERSGEKSGGGEKGGAGGREKNSCEKECDRAKERAERSCDISGMGPGRERTERLRECNRAMEAEDKACDRDCRDRPDKNELRGERQRESREPTTVSAGVAGKNTAGKAVSMKKTKVKAAVVKRESVREMAGGRF